MNNLFLTYDQIFTLHYTPKIQNNIYTNDLSLSVFSFSHYVIILMKSI